MNFVYYDVGSKISINLIGPFIVSTANTSHDNIAIETIIGGDDGVRVKRYLDIVRSSNDQIKLDTVSFIMDVDDKITTSGKLNLSLEFIAQTKDAISFQLSVDTHSLDTQIGAICGGIILICLNVLIITEVKNETFSCVLYLFYHNFA